MNTKARAKLIMIVVVFATVVFAFVVFTLIRVNQQSLSQAQSAGQIAFDVFERKILGDEYLNSGSIRARNQWFTKQTQIEDLVAKDEAKFAEPDEAEFVKQIKENLAVSEDAFQRLIFIIAANPTLNEQQQEKVTQLSSVLSVSAQETTSAAKSLKDFSEQRAVEAYQQLIIMFALATVLFVGVIIFCFIELWTSATELEKKRSETEAILKGIGDAVFALDNNKRIILFNSVAESLSGYNEGDVLGKKFSEVLKFIDERTGERSDEFISKAFLGEKSHIKKGVVLVSKTGEKTPVADTAAPVLSSKGKIEGVVVVFRDVSSERELDRAKDEFISLVSHQLRTPLTAIRLFTEMLTRHDIGKLNKTQEDYVKKVEASALRMIRLVTDILNVSRIELDRLKIEPVLTDVNKLIEVQIDEQKIVAEQHGVEVVFDRQKTGKVQVDPIVYGQIVHNFLTNSIKYCKEKSGKVEVRFEKTKNGYLLSVKDDGIGIPKDSQRHIFERFYRADNVTKADGEGTGLGLYLVKLIMDEINGKVWFESEQNKGTTFFAEIPEYGMKSKIGERSLN